MLLACPNGVIRMSHAIEGVAGTYNRYSYLDEKRAALDLWGAQWA